MSRVGRKPIPLPKGVKISVGDQLQVEGPKGKLSVPIPQGISISQADGSLHLLGLRTRSRICHFSILSPQQFVSRDGTSRADSEKYTAGRLKGRVVRLQ